MATKKSDPKNQLENSSDNWIAFAQVGRPHGLKGAFFLKTSDRRTTWDNYQKLLLETPEGPVALQVLKAYVSGGAVAVVTDVLSTREKAEAAYNAAISVHRSEIQTKEDEYLVSDLVGLKVKCHEKGELGDVVAVVNFGAQENLEIKIKGTSRTVYFPFIDQFVHKIDHPNGTIEILYAPEFFEDGKQPESGKLLEDGEQ